MNALLEDVRWKACLSAYRLDRFRLGELPAEEAADVQGHLDGCARCRAASETLASAEAEYRASALALKRPGLGRRTLAWAAVGAALAATCLVALRTEEAVRSKGAATSVGMYVLHGQSVRRALPGETVAPGDTVRFTYTSPSSTFLAILSVDGAGVASVYFPEGAETVSVPAANGAALPLGTRLDGVLGEEKVLALFCEHSQALEPIRAALARASAVPALPGCQLSTFHFSKRAP